MTPHELTDICEAVNLRYRQEYGTLATDALTTGLLRLLLLELESRRWQAPQK